MAHQSFMKSVFEAALELSAKNGGKVNAGKVSLAMYAKNRHEHKRVLNTLSQLHRTGRLARLQQGVYGPMPSGDQVLDKREIMKNVINIRRRVTVADLMEMAGVSRDYAREWLRLMTRNGALRKEQIPGLPAIWYRRREIVGVLDDTVKAGRLREIRKQKKQIINEEIYY